MLAKIKNIINSPHWQNFKDVRFLGLLGFGFLVLLTTWSGIRIVETNYKLQQQIAQLEQRNRLTKLENENLKLANQYYDTDTYLELIAREQFNKGQPGESLVLIPKEVALARAPENISQDQSDNAQNNDRPGYQQNFEAWLDFFFRRNI